MKIFSKDFVLYAGERMVKTFAQALLALIVVGTAINEIDWVTASATAATAAVVSLLTSITAVTGPTVTTVVSSPAEANTGLTVTTVGSAKAVVPAAENFQETVQVNDSPTVNTMLPLPNQLGSNLPETAQVVYRGSDGKPLRTN